MGLRANLPQRFGAARGTSYRTRRFGAARGTFGTARGTSVPHAMLRRRTRGFPASEVGPNPIHPDRPSAQLAGHSDRRQRSLRTAATPVGIERIAQAGAIGARTRQPWCLQEVGRRGFGLRRRRNGFRPGAGSLHRSRRTGLRPRQRRRSGFGPTRGRVGACRAFARGRGSSSGQLARDARTSCRPAPLDPDHTRRRSSEPRRARSTDGSSTRTAALLAAQPSGAPPAAVCPRAHPRAGRLLRERAGDPFGDAAGPEQWRAPTAPSFQGGRALLRGRWARRGFRSPREARLHGPACRGLGSDGRPATGTSVPLGNIADPKGFEAQGSIGLRPRGNAWPVQRTLWWSKALRSGGHRARPIRGNAGGRRTATATTRGHEPRFTAGRLPGREKLRRVGASGDGLHGHPPSGGRPRGPETWRTP